MAAKMRPDLPCKLPTSVRKKLSLRFEEDELSDQAVQRPVPSRHELQRSATIDRDDHTSYYYEFPREEPTFLSAVAEGKKEKELDSDSGSFTCQVASKGQPSDQLTSGEEEMLPRSSLNYVEVSVVQSEPRSEFPVVSDSMMIVKPAATQEEEEEQEEDVVKNKERPKLPKKLSHAELSKANPLSLKLPGNSSEPDFSVNKKLIEDLDREDEDPTSNYYCQPFVATEQQPAELSLGKYRSVFTALDHSTRVFA